MIKTQIDAVAFEPPLGPIYKNPPLRKEAMETINELTIVYREVLRQVSTVLRPDGRVAMTIPVINTVSDPISVEFDELIDNTGLGLYRMLSAESIKTRKDIDTRLKIRPERELIPERKRGQIVQRAIIVLEK